MALTVPAIIWYCKWKLNPAQVYVAQGTGDANIDSGHGSIQGMEWFGGLTLKRLGHFLFKA